MKNFNPFLCRNCVVNMVVSLLSTFGKYKSSIYNNVVNKKSKMINKKIQLYRQKCNH